jgi:hypothetical protein
MILILQHVASEERDIRKTFDGLRRQLLHSRIDFDGDHRTGQRRKRGGQAAGAGADFENQIRRAEFRLSDEKIQQVQIDEKVLAQFVPRPQPMASQQLADVSSRLAYGFFHVPCFISPCFV